MNRTDRDLIADLKGEWRVRPREERLAGGDSPRCAVVEDAQGWTVATTTGVDSAGRHDALRLAAIASAPAALEALMRIAESDYTSRPHVLIDEARVAWVNFRKLVEETKVER